jgi:hypothetical protein
MSEKLDLIHPRTRIFNEYWQSLPKRNFLPDRDQIDLTQLKDILPSFVILQYESPVMVRFRLAGTEEVQRYGFEVTGRNYLDFVPDHRKQEAVSTFKTMLKQPCGSLHLIETVTSLGRVICNEAIGYPMRGSDGKADQLLFQSNDLDGKLSPYQRTDVVAEHRRILQRRFIDIGAGLSTQG